MLMPEDMTIQHVYGGSPEPMKIKVEKNSKGYNWEITISGKDLEEILPKLNTANAMLKIEYGNKE